MTEKKKATRKCQWCKEKGFLDEMEVELVGNEKVVRKCYHTECHIDYLKDKAFKAKEQIKKDSLNEVLKEIYGVKEIPSQAWTLLESLRNGQAVFGAKQSIGKRYKEGYEWSLIQETFEHCSDTIEYWNGVKNFNGFMGAFKYAMTIIIDKIYFVEQRVANREKQKDLMEKHVDNLDDSIHEFESNYKKPTKTQKSITDFLDD